MAKSKKSKRKTFVHVDRDGDYIVVTAVLKIGALNKSLDEVMGQVAATVSKMHTPPIVETPTYRARRAAKS